MEDEGNEESNLEDLESIADRFDHVLLDTGAFKYRKKFGNGKKMSLSLRILEYYEKVIFEKTNITLIEDVLDEFGFGIRKSRGEYTDIRGVNRGDKVTRRGREEFRRALDKSNLLSSIKCQTKSRYLNLSIDPDLFFYVRRVELQYPYRNSIKV